MPVGAGGERVAEHHRRRRLRAGVADVVRPPLPQRRAVCQRVGAGEGRGPFGQWGVQGEMDVIDGPAGGDVLRTLRRRFAPQRNQAVGPAFGYLPGVDFVEQVAIHHMTRPHRAAQAHIFRVSTRDAGDEPVGAREIKPRVEPQRHHARRGVGDAAADANA